MTSTAPPGKHRKLAGYQVPSGTEQPIMQTVCDPSSAESAGMAEFRPPVELMCA